MSQPNTYSAGPDEGGHFDLFGGRFVAETLMPLILDLESAWNSAKDDPAFAEELTYFLTHYAGPVLTTVELHDGCVRGL